MPSAAQHHLSLPDQVPPPTLTLGRGPLHALPADVAAVPVLPAPADDPDGGPLLGPGADELGDALGVDLLGVLEAARATGRAGETTTHLVPGGTPDNPRLRLVLLVGVGEQRPDDLRRAGAAVARASRDRDTVATTVPSLVPDEGVAAFVAGAVLGSFVFHWRSRPLEHVPARQVVLAGFADRKAVQPVVDRAVAIAAAGWRSRYLATVPSNLKNPPWLADQAARLGRDAGLEVTVWDEQRLASDGFGGLLAVGQGSATPPRLIRLDYRPKRGGRRAPTVVLVGKGITFDSGGLSIKPAEAMSNMKRDVTGGAVVLATMAALADVGCPVRVVGLVAAAENAVDGSSLRPGDVVRHYGGRTSEVTNTDAEGRLVLADALAYAVQELRPDAVVDVATLTGAMKVALGQQVGGFFANDEALAASLSTAAEAAGEPLWRMPLAAAYEDKLASKVADADNAPGGPGAIVAALFLQHFVGDVPWAHLDVASVGDAPHDRDEWTPGPTGFGARALLHWLGGPDPLAGVRAAR